MDQSGGVLWTLINFGAPLLLLAALAYGVMRSRRTSSARDTRADAATERMNKQPEEQSEREAQAAEKRRT